MELYTFNEISASTGIPRITLYFRAEKNQIPKRYKDNNIAGTRQVRCFNSNEVEIITNKQLAIAELPKIIYVHTVFHIQESRMNFNELNQL